MQQNAIIFDATQASFDQDVLLASMHGPILVDFWAPWCGPCKQLTPIIEKVVSDLGGAVRLAKVNTDEEMAIAAMFQIRSLPTVMLLMQGQPVDGFMGAQPESAIRAMLERHLGPLDQLQAKVEEIEPETDAHESDKEMDWQQRAEELRDAIANNPDQSDIKIDYAEALIHLGQVSEAELILEHLPADAATSDAAKRCGARLGFARALVDAPAREALVQRVQANSDDLQARYFLGARALFGNDAPEAVAQFLHIMRSNRKFQDDLGRKSLIAAMILIRDEDLVAQTRRKMSALIF